MEVLSKTQNVDIQWLKDFKTPLITSVGLAAIALAVVFGVLPCCGLSPRTVLLLQVLLGATTVVAGVPLITYLSAKASFFRQQRKNQDLIKSSIGISPMA